MGVPKFFRYISERYPCLSELIREDQIPEFDNLYLDMNGIIHVCSHPNDFDPHFRISEEQIFQDIFHYIEILFRLIRPKKLFFMAVDGVAPRAKMNQQRGRRFRTAKEAEVLEARAKSKGEVLPDQTRFDSNCITPGTEFMARLHSQLQYFVSHKVSTDKIWQIPTVILSGHQAPGEGEHKIMDYIRHLRSKEGWDPNTRHCLCGLDADLIMLGLCTHEPNFSLLREEVKFGRKSQKRIPTPEETNFYLLHLSLLRDYLDLEFQELKENLPFGYDLERIIDDWVLMGFLVGNDFIPNLPGLNIADGALHLLYKTYINVLPKLGGYINDGGTLNLPRFEQYMKELSKFDLDQFKDAFMDIKYLESKGATTRDLQEFGQEEKIPNSMDQLELQQLVANTQDAVREEDDSGDESDVDTSEDERFMTDFIQYKKKYYEDKLDYEKVTSEVLTSQAEGYVRAVQWILHYYYNGCPSWSWFYPHHYAPYISDIKSFSNLKIDFELGIPFLPFQQLMAVLPSASKNLLPEPLQVLMTDKDSPIIHFYPKDFDLDMNGKKQEWEAVVLIPFIEQESLLSAMEPCYEKFTEDEKTRNSQGPIQIYNYSEESLGTYNAPDYFPSVTDNHAKCKQVWSTELMVERRNLVKGLYPGAGEALHLGFPTLKNVKFDACLKKNGVKVFEHPSRNENMILHVINDDTRALKEIAEDLLSRPYVYVGWPKLIPARIDKIMNSKELYRMTEQKVICTKPNNFESNAYRATRNAVNIEHKTKLGIELGELTNIVYVRLQIGSRLEFDNTGSFAKECIVWSEEILPFPLDTTVAKINVVTKTKGDLKQVTDVFPLGSTVFIMSAPLYSSMGTVVSGSCGGRVKVYTPKTLEPDLSSIARLNDTCKKMYITGSVAGNRLGIGPYLLSRVTGSIFMHSVQTESDKVNFGLNLKFNKRGEELLGFTKKEGTMWLYSNDALNLVRSYMDKFPEIFEFLHYKTGDDIYFKEDIYKKNTHEKVQELVNWLKEQPHNLAERRAVGVISLEEDAVKGLERIVSKHVSKSIKKTTCQVRPYLLYLPRPELGIVPDPKAEHRLLDRIVHVRECHTIPVGYKGTIIGIEKKESEDATVYDVLFDDAFVGGLKRGCQDTRCYRLTRQSFINLSYGVRTEQATPIFASSKDQPSTMDLGNSSAFANCRSPENQLSYQQNHTKETTPPIGILTKKPNQKLDSTPKQVRLAPTTLTKGEIPKDEDLAASITQQTDALKKVLKIKDNSEASLRPDVPPLVAQVKKPLIKPCGHVNCFTALVTLCSKMGIAQPSYNYITNQITNEITCTLRFPAISKDIIGLPDKEKAKAAESAACQAVQLLNSELQHVVNRHNQVRPPPFYQPFHRANQMLMNQNLPTPPQQWYQAHNNKMPTNSPDSNQWKWKHGEQHGRVGHQQQHQPKPNNVNKGQVNQFVPLQVQMGSRAGSTHSHRRLSHDTKSNTSTTTSSPSITANHLETQGAIITNDEPKENPPRKDDKALLESPGGTAKTTRSQRRIRNRLAAKFPLPLEPK